MSDPTIQDAQGVSVITPVYNEVEWLDTTVPSLLNLSADEWIWVDDGSTDGSAALLSSLIKGEPRARLIRLPSNQGRAVARNTAIEAATQPWLAFVNANVYPAEDFLEAHFRTLDAFPGAIASVGCGILNGSEQGDPYFRYLAQGRRGPQTQEGPIAWRFFVTTGSVVRRDCVFDVGGFPPNIVYGVDPALASRLRRKDPNGLVYSPEAAFEMLRPSTLDGILTKLELFGQGLALLNAEDPTILSWTRLGFIDKPLGGALVRSERMARLARSLSEHSSGFLQRRSIRYLLAHATAVGYHPAS